MKYSEEQLHKLRIAYVIWCFVGTALLLEGLGWLMEWGHRTIDGPHSHWFGVAVIAVIFFIGWLLDRADRRAAASAPPKD